MPRIFPWYNVTFTLYFIRHGQTDWNAAGRIQGQIDIPINDTGRGQARRNGETLAQLLDTPGAFNFIASPLSRPRETMEIIRDALGLEAKDFPTDKRLMEISFGRFEGLTFDEISEKMPEAQAHREKDKWLNGPPQGESYAELTARIEEWYRELDRNTICVAHGGVSRALRGIVLKLPPAEIAELEVPQDKVLKIEAGQIEWI